MALATMTLHDTVIELLRTFMTLPSPCHGTDMALPWAVVFVGLDDTAMAMSRGSVMDCRDKAMGLATAW